LPSVAARVHGYTSAQRLGDNAEGGKSHCLCVVAELCEDGNLEDFMEAEGAPLSPAVKLDIMLQVAAGLDQLKEARVLWRDLKAKNLLVRVKGWPFSPRYYCASKHIQSLTTHKACCSRRLMHIVRVRSVSMLYLIAENFCI
jgi:serine/threonine protein kinase